eukprot:1852556-Prymnesium_polylepis.1
MAAHMLPAQRPLPFVCGPSEVCGCIAICEVGSVVGAREEAPVRGGTLNDMLIDVPRSCHRSARKVAGAARCAHGRAHLDPSRFPVRRPRSRGAD